MEGRLSFRRAQIKAQRQFNIGRLVLLFYMNVNLYQEKGSESKIFWNSN
jgi:hypothetical protein